MSWGSKTVSVGVKPIFPERVEGVSVVLDGGKPSGIAIKYHVTFVMPDGTRTQSKTVTLPSNATLQGVGSVGDLILWLARQANIAEGMPEM